MYLKFSIESSWSVRDVSSLSVSEVSVVSGLSSFALDLNYLDPEENGDTCFWRHLYFWSPEVFLSWFGIGSFLGGDIASDFFWNVFSDVILARVYTGNTELIDIPVRKFSTTINSGAGASDWVIKFGPLATFCVLIYSLSNVISRQIGATTFTFAF